MKAVFGKKIYVGDGSVFENTYIVFENGRIIDITKEKPNCDVLGEYSCISPAFIDAHSHIGLDRFGEPYDEGDVNEHMESLNFGLQVRDAIIMEDKCFKDAVDHGVLYSCVLPGSGNIIGGRGAIIRNFSETIDSAFIKNAGIKCAFGYNPKSTDDWKGTRPTTRGGAVFLLRNALHEAENNRKLIERNKKDVEELDLNERIALDLVMKKTHLRIHVHKGDDLLNALRIAQEFNIDIVIDHAGDVHKKEIFDVLAARNISLVYGPMDSHAYKVELLNENWKNVKPLLNSRTNFAIMTDHPVVLARNLHLQLRFLLRYGVRQEEAIKHITSIPAKILGLEELGTLEIGKLASFVAWSADLFSLSAHTVSIFAEGKEIKQK